MTKFAKHFLILLLLIPCGAFSMSIPSEDFSENMEVSEFVLPNANFALWYSGDFMNAPVGDLLIEFKETDTTYRIEAQIRAAGFIKLLTKFKSISVTEGIKRDGLYIPQKFTTWWRVRKKEKRVTVHYDENGRVIKEEYEPEKERHKRPRVSEDLKHYRYDPLTFALLARHRMKTALEKHEKRASGRVYDGRKLSELYFDLKGDKKIKHNAQNKPTIKISANRKPIAGFKQKELDAFKNEDPIVDIFVDTAHMLPLTAIGVSSWGTATIQLEKVCADMAECYRKYKD